MFSLSLRGLLFSLAVSMATAVPAFAGALSAGAIGQTTFVIGQVHARDSAGMSRPLARGAEVFKGDVITTGADAVAQLRFVDDSRMVIRRSSEISIDDYEFGAARESMVVRLAFGALRSITGLIGSKDKRNVQFRTEVATIGIRGTDFEAVHVPVGRGDLFGAGEKIDPGTYNKVYSGGTHLESKQGSLDLNINESGFIGLTQGLAKSPVRIDQLPPVILKVISETPQVSKSPAPAPAPPGAPGNAATEEAAPGSGDARGAVKQVDVTPSVLPAPAPEASPDGKTLTTLPVLKTIDTLKIDDAKTLSTETVPTLISPTTTTLKSDTTAVGTLPQVDPAISTTTKTLAPTTTTISPTLIAPTTITPTTTTTTTTLPTTTTTTIKTLSPTTTTILNSTTLKSPLLQR